MLDEHACMRAALAWAHQHVVLQDGEYILKEGEALTSTSKFYLVQSGTVECFKQFSVGSWPCSWPSDWSSRKL